MKIFYHDHFVLPLPENHRFPMRKYAALRRRIVQERLVPPGDLRVAPPAGDTDLHRAHSADYVRRVTLGNLSRQEIRRIGFPWSPQMVERSRRSVGSTIAAGRFALEEGVAANLAGGTHHAGPDWGQGFCVFNDSAVAARALQAAGFVQRVVILDCDVHQGNGTAAIFRTDPTVFTFSIHGERNFPFQKEPGDLDIPLPDGTGDEAYLAALEPGLCHALERAQAGLAIYLAGADPFHGDRLGRLALTKAGLLARDRMVLSMCKTAGIPVAVVMAGGYAPAIEDIVDIHFQTISEALKL